MHVRAITHTIARLRIASIMRINVNDQRQPHIAINASLSLQPVQPAVQSTVVIARQIKGQPLCMHAMRDRVIMDGCMYAFMG